jgi:hypothetical protein
LIECLFVLKLLECDLEGLQFDFTSLYGRHHITLLRDQSGVLTAEKVLVILGLGNERALKRVFDHFLFLSLLLLLSALKHLGLYKEPAIGKSHGKVLSVWGHV